MIELILIFNIVILVWINIRNYLSFKKKISVADKIRQGYEKKCNSFRIKYTMLSKLENMEKVLNNIKEINKSIYIYGGGYIGDKLFKILDRDKSINLLRIIESNELKESQSYGDSLDKQAIIIITPMFDYEKIKELLVRCGVLENNIMGLDEFV